MSTTDGILIIFAAASLSWVGGRLFFACLYELRRERRLRKEEAELDAQWERLQ